MKLGATSFAFRYLLLDPNHAPPLASLVERARCECGLDRFQVCENARPLDLSEGEWRAVLGRAAEIGLEIRLGCKTLSLDVLQRYLERTPGNLLRVVLEEDGGERPNRDTVVRLLDGIVPRLQAGGTRLAIENHVEIPSSLLAEIAAAYPASSVGFCVDVANSLRNFETAECVLAQLAPRAFCYHLKDYKLTGTPVSFTVTGAPLGAGALDLDRVLDTILSRDPFPELYVENWTPPTGDRDTDVEVELLWLRRGLKALASHAARVASQLSFDCPSRPDGS